MQTAELAREIEALRERLSSLHASSVKAAERNVLLERENKILREELAILKQGLFGRRTERIDPGQLALFLKADGVVDAEAPAPESADTSASVSRAKRGSGHGRTQFPEHLPRDPITLDVPEAERICPDCQKPLRQIGEDITERGHIVPAQIVVRRYVRMKYVCPAGHCVKAAALPDGVIEGAKYEASEMF
jgi:hypothetical protein